MDTLAETDSLEESVNWNFVPLAVFGAAMVALVYVANFAFWWLTVPRLVRLGTNPYSHAPLPQPIQVLSTWSDFIHHYALLVLPVLAVLATFHARAMFDRSSPRRRLFAWLGMWLVGLALIAQYGFALLSLVLNMGK